VVQDFGGAARFAVENYGDSALARRFGVKRYPAIFVDDILVATPKDFGFFGKGEGTDTGRYAPLKSAASHRRFRADLTRMVKLVLAGRTDLARARARTAQGGEIASLPALSLVGLDGAPIRRKALAGRVVVVEFWATWCPPCRGTLAWLGDVARRHGDRVTVVALAVESDEPGVRAVMKELGAPITWAMATPALARKFGDISAVPTLFVFDRDGRTRSVHYGAPPELHAEVEAELDALLAPRR